MKGNFRRSMIWLHTYSGLLLSWLLFTVFVTGTLSYYADELNVWMQPEKLSQRQHLEPIPLAISALNEKARGASRWNISLGNERDPKTEIRWQYPGQGRRDGQRQTLSTTDAEPRETLGGSFFIHFHYSLELRNYGGRYLTGIAAFIMLVGVFSGIFTHRRFFKDFFVLRWQKLRRAMTDAHAIIGIVTIPFCFVICFSALLFYLSLYVPASATYHYEKGYRQLSSEISPKSFSREAAGIQARPIQDISPILDQVNAAWPEPRGVSWVSYYHPYDKNAYLVFYRNKSDLSRQSETLTFDAGSGELLHKTEPPRIPKLISYVFLGLHEAKFADNSLRFILFILGGLSSALIATGSVLWLNSRIERDVSHAGTRLIDWSNRAVFGGLPVAVLALLLANRLLPVSMADRAGYEMLGFLSGWGLSAILAAVLRRSAFWPLMLKTFAVACLALPVLDLVLAPHYLLTAIGNNNLAFAAVEFALVVAGMLALILNRYISQRNQAATTAVKGNTLNEVTSC